MICIKKISDLCLMLCFLVINLKSQNSSHFQENSLTVQEVQEFQQRQNVADRPKLQRLRGLSASIRQVRQTGLGMIRETDESLRQQIVIELTPITWKKKSPLPPSQHIDNVIKQGEHPNRIGSDNADKRTAPQLFVDREHQTPQHPRQQ